MTIHLAALKTIEGMEQKRLERGLRRPWGGHPPNSAAGSSSGGLSSRPKARGDILRQQQLAAVISPGCPGVQRGSR